MTSRPQKTLNMNNKRIEIPLSKSAIQLIKDENPLKIKGLIFNCVSEQRMNQHIIEVASVAKVDKQISFHTARHTFATLFLKKRSKANGLIMLQQLLGRSNIDGTMGYSHVLNDDIKEAIEEFNFQ